MKSNYSKLIFIMDRSGSMSSIWTDAVGGFNQFVKDQKAIEGGADLSLIAFDTEYEVAIDKQDLQLVEGFDTTKYGPRGGTALIDAIGKTINTVGQELAQMNEDERPENVILTIMTDGQENASNEFTQSQVKEMLEHQQNKYNWKVMFLGANIDAANVSQGFGIPLAHTIQYASTGSSSRAAYAQMDSFAGSVRTKSAINLKNDVSDA